MKKLLLPLIALVLILAACGNKKIVTIKAKKRLQNHIH